MLSVLLYFVFLCFTDINCHYGEEFLPRANVYKGDAMKSTEGFPFIVLLYGDNFCTGSLISTTTILTAAHCVCSEREFSMALFEHVDFDQPAYKNRPISHSEMSPEWKPSCERKLAGDKTDLTNGVDVAVVHLKYSVDDNYFKVAPVLLALNTDMGGKIGQIVHIIGYGKNEDKGQGVLRKGQGVLAKCLKNFKGDPLCVINLLHFNHQRTNSGDSGGPLLYKHYIQIGVLSGRWIIKIQGTPGLHTMVFSSLVRNKQFILKHL